MSKLKANDVGLKSYTATNCTDLVWEHGYADSTLRPDRMSTKDPSLNISFLLPLQFYLHFLLLRTTLLSELTSVSQTCFLLHMEPPFPLLKKNQKTKNPHNSPCH